MHRVQILQKWGYHPIMACKSDVNGKEQERLSDYEHEMYNRSGGTGRNQTFTPLDAFIILQRKLSEFCKTQ